MGCIGSVRLQKPVGLAFLQLKVWADIVVDRVLIAGPIPIGAARYDNIKFNRRLSRRLGHITDLYCDVLPSAVDTVADHYGQLIARFGFVIRRVDKIDDAIL